METAFFIASKLGWALIRPDSWIVIGLLIGFVAVMRGWQRLARWSVGLTAAFVVVLAAFPVGELLLRPLERRHAGVALPDRIDGIILLGGGEDADRSARSGMAEVNDAAERFTETLALARRHPQARVIFTGGSGALRDLGGPGLSGADVARQFFAAQPIDPSRILYEDRSRNTAENARLSLVLADPQPGEGWVLVTSAFHMPRAMRSFAAAGWDGIVPYPVDHRTVALSRGIGWNLSGNLVTLTTALREHVGLLAYRVAGR